MAKSKQTEMQAVVETCNKVMGYTKKSKEVNMTNNVTEEKQFDNFAYVKGALLQEYVRNLLAGKDLTELTFAIKNYHKNSFVIEYLNKQNALKVANITVNESADATGKLTKVYSITVKDFNLNATAKSKAGNDFRLFDEKSIGRALLKARA